jgi:Flp pilus assembly pilin Flp
MRTEADRGSSAVEFGLLLAALAMCIVGAASVAGRGLQSLFTDAMAMIVG